MYTPPVFLPIEVKRRELDSKLLIALHIAKAGIPVFIGDRSGCARELKFNKNCIYLAKSLSIDLLPVFKDIKKHDGKIMVLFEEGGLVAKENDKFDEIKSFYPANVLPYVDVLLTYGSSFQNLVIENIPQLNQRNTHVIGNTRFDLHKLKFFPLYKETVDKIKSKYGKYILVNTNFSFANHVFGEDYIINELKNNKDFTPQLKEKYIERVNLKKVNIEEFLVMIKYIAKEFSEYTILVRPHPGEKVELYKNALKEIKNISVTNENIATPWIIGAELLIHQDCTTGIESYLAGKPIISYMPFEDPNLSWLSYHISDKAKNLVELKDKLTYYLKEENKFILPSEKLETLTHEVINVNQETGPLILVKVKELISEMSRSKSKLNISQLLNRFYKRKKYILSWNRNKYIRKDQYTTNFEGLTKKEISQLFNNLCEIEGISSNNFTIRSTSKNMFVIELKK